MVLVCGLPSSGNHLVRETILRCSRAQQPYTRKLVLVWHGGPHDWTPKPTKEELKHARIVIPVRDPRCRKLSVKARGLPDNWPEDFCVGRVLAFAYEHRLRVKHVSYEAFCLDGDGVGSDLAEWLGLPWIPFPDSIRPEDPARGALYDGNAKYAGLAASDSPPPRPRRGSSGPRPGPDASSVA